MKKLGVIGGLGPIATAYFYELIIKMTEATVDQEHIEMMIFSKPSIPDRTDYILGRSLDNPAASIIEIGKMLVTLGADYIAIPCITAHYFHDTLSEEIHTPIIHIIRETVGYLSDRGIRQAGIMATDGTIYSRLFQEELQAKGIEPLIPSKRCQGYVTNLIYKDIKANKPPEMDKFNEVADELKAMGAEVIILGCTELSLVKRDYDIGPGFIDAMEVLAMSSVSLCGGKLKTQYQSLITNK
ncbi:MAG TPA: amino acid racemase [Mobilitalea sp.]|nr:amino acid racemase [Mobilitalea sp.]